MSVYVELKKPEHRKEDLWRQHLHWWEVMSKQVDENLVRYREHAERRAASRK